MTDQLPFTCDLASLQLFGQEHVDFDNQFKYKRVIKLRAVVENMIRFTNVNLDVVTTLNFVHHLAIALYKNQKNAAMESTYLEMMEKNLLFVIELLINDA